MRAVLTYHSVDDSGSVISVPPAVFREHASWLATGVVRVVGLDALSTLSDNDDAVAVTFDDGLSSVGDIAAPLLAEHGLTATIFAVTDHVGRDNRWNGVSDAKIQVQGTLDWDALGRLGEAGWTIGSHTRRHPQLTKCTDMQLQDELEGSIEAIRAHLGNAPADFAYPYGDRDGRVTAAVARRFARAVTTEHRVLHDSLNRHAIPRLDAWYFRGPGELERWHEPGFRRRIAARHLLRRLRRIMT